MNVGKTMETVQCLNCSAVAIITARGGSKRIPRKNIRDFCGRPIIEYSIEAALESGVFEEVMVSTEDEEIAALARKNGAKVPFLRSEATSDDYATTAEVLIEVLQRYQRMGKMFHCACCIYPTAPFITASRLREAMALLEEKDTEAVVPVTVFSFPPMRGMYIREGRLSYCWPEYAAARSQDLEPMYHDCGQFYCFKPECLLKTGTLIPKHTKALVVPEKEVQDIDMLDDWTLAEMKYQHLLKRAD